jgi:glutamate synthase (NADPH/NADH)
MKLDKAVVQRRVDLMAAEGVNFITNAHVGVNTDAAQIKADNDAVIVATGATWPRDLKLPNRDVDGIHFAMDYLHPNTKSLLDSELSDEKFISAKGKDVIVIGGGDTGNDCIGTAVRHGAKSVVNFELLPEPPASRASNNPWPQFARVKKTDYGHSEVMANFSGKDPREYCISTKKFVVDDEGKLLGLDTVRVEWTQQGGNWKMEEVRGSEQVSETVSVISVGGEWGRVGKGGGVWHS